MVYGITILTDAPNPKLAGQFLEFVLAKDKGVKIMEENGQPSILKTNDQSKKNIPENLLKYFSD